MTIHGADGPHRAARRWMRRIGHGGAYLGLLALAGFSVFVFVAAVHDSGSPVTWGTFAEQRTESGGRGGEQVYGAWRSDDGRTVLGDVLLDGSIGPDGTKRAYVQRASLLLGADETVHDGTRDWLGFAAPPVFFVLSLAFIAFLLWYWDDLGRPRRRMLRR